MVETEPQILSQVQVLLTLVEVAEVLMMFQPTQLRVGPVEVEMVVLVFLVQLIPPLLLELIVWVAVEVVEVKVRMLMLVSKVELVLLLSVSPLLFKKISLMCNVK